MTRQEILQNVYTKLRVTGAVRSRQDFAEKIDYNYSCTSAAFNGAERYLTDRFFTRILKAFPQVSATYIRSGEGDILTVDEGTASGTGILPLVTEEERQPAYTATDMEKVMAALAEQQELTRRAQEQTEKALGQIDKLIEIIRTMSDVRGEGM